MATFWKIVQWSKVSINGILLFLAVFGNLLKIAENGNLKKLNVS